MKRTVFITGSMGNLGSAAVKRFSQEGYHVVATVSPGKKERSDESAIEIWEADLTNETSTADTIGKVISKHKKIDAALLLVGGFAAGGIKETDGASLEKMISLNFNTAFFAAREIFSHMMTQPEGGRIVLVGSRPALNPKEGKDYLAYSLSKSLIFKLAEFLNAEGASKNVVVSVIVPGTIDTPQNREAMPGKDFQQWVTPEEIAHAMSYLCSAAGHSLREPVMKIFGKS